MAKQYSTLKSSAFSGLVAKSGEIASRHKYVSKIMPKSASIPDEVKETFVEPKQESVGELGGEEFVVYYSDVKLEPKPQPERPKTPERISYTYTGPSTFRPPSHHAKLALDIDNLVKHYDEVLTIEQLAARGDLTVSHYDNWGNTSHSPLRKIWTANLNGASGMWKITKRAFNLLKLYGVPEVNDE